MNSSIQTLLSRGALAMSLGLLLCLTGTAAIAKQPLIGLDVAAEQGDLLIDGKAIRLYGIHFPTQPGLCSEQIHGCRDLGLEALVDWLADAGQVDCDVLSVTSTGTHIARCRQDQIDLGAWLIGHGYALADRRGGRGYLRDEQSARGDNIGLWGKNDLLARY